MLLPRDLVLLQDLLGRRGVEDVVDGPARVEDGVPAALQPQAHGPEGLQERIAGQGNNRMRLAARVAAHLAYGIARRGQLEADGLARVPAFREVEGHDVVGRVDKPLVGQLVVHGDARDLQDALAVGLELVLLDLLELLLDGFGPAG